MAVSGIYDYHVTKAGPKCTLVWMASCFVIPPSVKCRHLETWQEIPDELNSVENDVDSENIMPRLLTHADLHAESTDNEFYRLSPEPYTNERSENGKYEENVQNDFNFEDPVDDYLAEYANMISSREHEEQENYQEVHVTSPERGKTHEERRNIFARRKSCSDVSKAGLSMSLSVPKDQTVDDLHVSNTPSSPSKPEKSSLKNITAMARRMSIPILDKSEDVDHGTKVYGEKLIKKSRSTKQFREAFSEEQGDYIPHRAPKTLSKSLTTSEIEYACDELKTESPGSFKNVITELKLRTTDYGDNRRYTNDLNSNNYEISGPKLTKSLTTSEIERSHNDPSVESPTGYRNVMKELQQKTEDYSNDRYHNNYDSHGGNTLDLSFNDSFTSDVSHTSHTLRRNRTTESRPVSSDSAHMIRLNNSPRIESRSVSSDIAHMIRLNDSPRIESRPVSSDSAHMIRLRDSPRIESRPVSSDSAHMIRLNDSPRDDVFSKTLPVGGFDAYLNGSSTPRNNNYDQSVRNKPFKQRNEEPVSDIMKKLTNLTAQTRLATRPSLGNVEGYESSPSPMMRSQSVMSVSSPVALSPKYERNPLSSSFSSSASSSSDIPVLSYHSVVDPCYRCWKTVYSLDKVGPIRKVLYHKMCFRCVVCNTMLSLNTYRQNVNDKTDVQVYCKKHVPSQESPHISLESKNLNVMMHHPKLDNINTNIRGTKEDRRKSQSQFPLSIGRAVSTPRLDLICGPNENSDSNNTSTLDRNGNVSLRELKMDDTPKSVWSRSSFSAAKLDLTVPASGRTGSSLYRTVDAWNYL